MRAYKIYRNPDGSIYANFADMILQNPNGSKNGELIAEGECENFKKLFEIKREHEKGISGEKP